ncbi:MAG: VirB3 family type IV secretion system protein [Spirochaetaceae bacterium]|jgi:type IV secretory pathway VirB3-like protein|nr:VirB3 family type IV secretion system protein [Spirochaetaceae bacterium]
MADMRPFSRIVHRSLLQRELMAGIPQAGLFILFMLAVVFIYGLELYFMLVPILILYLVMRHLTAKDPWFIDIVLENITQKDRFLP